MPRILMMESPLSDIPTAREIAPRGMELVIAPFGSGTFKAAHPGATLADLYDPLAMPPNLVAAHAANDRAVDAAYGQPRGFATEAARLAFLFERYQALAAPLDVAPAPRRRARRAG